MSSVKSAMTCCAKSGLPTSPIKKETIHHNQTGLIVEKPQSELIASTIQHYFDNDYKSEFSKNIEIEKAENSWENFASKIIQFSKEL